MKVSWKVSLVTALVFLLTLSLLGAAISETNETSLFSSPLWEDVEYHEDSMEAGSSTDFVPSDPQNYTWALMLAKDSYYRPMGRMVGEYVSDAFYMLHDELAAMHKRIDELFRGRGLQVGINSPTNPNRASVAIVADIQFPRAGTYGLAAMINAFNCELTLTAYDILTHEVIAELFVGDYYGETIKANPNAHTIAKEIPDPNDAAEEDKEAFVRALSDFWSEWKAPQDGTPE